MGEISTIGLDIAKNIFQVHGADASGVVILRKKIGRARLLAFFAAQPPCVVAMEACGGAHHWGRELARLGHTVRLIPPAYVKPFVKRHKNDAADAEAICEAAHVAQLIERIENPAELLPESARAILCVLIATLRALDEQIAVLDAEIGRRAKADPIVRRLMTIPGVGPITATAIVALAPPPGTFKAGRHFAAWLGLTPLQKSTGGKQKLGAISKMGERTLRRVLTIGASAVVKQALRRGAPVGSWLAQMLARKPKMLVIVALANKTARIVWALLAQGGVYRAREVATA